MGKPESSVWDELADALLERGTLTRGDGFALEILAKSLMNCRRDYQSSVEAGPTTESGWVASVKQSPERQAFQSSARLALDFLKEFGLTPRSRADVRVFPTAGSTRAAMVNAPGDAYWAGLLKTS
jgi:phage terminase small subunit